MSSVFISYSRVDKEFVDKLASQLRSQGISVWIDDRQIKVGQKIPRRIKEGIFNSDYFLIVISRGAVKSNWVKEELDSAYFEAVVNKPDSILPVLLDDMPMPKELQSLKYADFRQNFEQGFQELMRVFEIDEDYIEFLPRSEREKRIRQLLNTVDKWGEMPSEIVALVEDESYLPLFEDNLRHTQRKQIVYNSVDAIKALADYEYDHKIIRDHSSILPLIALYKATDDSKLRQKIVSALAQIGSKLCYDFLVTILRDANATLKAEILVGLWDMSSSGYFADWNPALRGTLHSYTSWPVEKCLYYDYESEESDFRFWVFRCLAEAQSKKSLPHIERFLESETWPLATLAEAAAAHWHITGATKYIKILRKAKRLKISCSAHVTLDEIKTKQAKNKS